MELTYKAFEAEVKALDNHPRRMHFLISTGGVDRDNDTIDPKGWQLQNYMKNPIVAFGHNYRELPVAKCTHIATTEKGLEAIAEFPPIGTYKFADTVFDMLKGGFLSATSVGFRPTKVEENRERKGFDFKIQELTEFSIVPIPSNPEALVQQRGGQADAQVRHWTKALLDWAQKAAPTPARAQIGRLMDSEPWTKNDKAWDALEKDYDTESEGKPLSVARLAKLLALHGFSQEADELGNKSETAKAPDVDIIAQAVVAKLLKPMPVPAAGEKQDDFMKRCMSELASDFSDDAQRTAICSAQWSRNQRAVEQREEPVITIKDDGVARIKVPDNAFEKALESLGPELSQMIAGRTQEELNKALGRID